MLPIDNWRIPVRLKRIKYISRCVLRLELADDLSSKTYIICLSRFVVERGPPTRICCDNAPNFVDAARELIKLSISSGFLLLNY